MSNSSDDEQDEDEEEEEEEIFSANTSVRLSFLGESFECRQKVEPWIRKMSENEGSGGATALRRGRSLGIDLLPTPGGAASNQQLRRGGSECRQPSVEIPIEQWQQRRNQLSSNSFNFSSFSSTLSEPPSSHYPVSPFQSTDLTDANSIEWRNRMRSPSPRLERQEALKSEPSMETHASASLEVDSGACGGSVSQQQHLSFESQYSTASGGGGCGGGLLSSNQRISSFESETSVETGGGGGGGGGRSPLLSRRRKCLSAGASPCSSPPICLSNSRHNLVGGSRNNLCTGSSSEYGDQPTDPSPSPPAEIYLTVPVLTPAKTLLDKSRQLRQKFKRHGGGAETSSRSSSDSKEVSVIPVVRSHHQLSRSIEVGLPTAHHHVDYHELAGSARRQHWVSRLK